MGADSHRLDRRTWRAWLGEKVSHHFHRVTHHVVEDAAALKRTLPEPRHVWTAVLLGGAREVRPTRERRAARPNELATARDVRSKELILEVAGAEPDALHQLHHLLRLRDIARERLLAGEPSQCSRTGLDRVDDLFDVGEARVIRTTQPESIDGGVRHHIADRLVRARLSDVKLSGESGRRCGVFFVRTPDAADIYLTDRSQRLDVEAGVEATADEADAETLCAHFSR